MKNMNYKHFEKWIKQFVLVVGNVMFFAFFVPAIVFAANQTGTFEGHPLFEQHLEPPEIEGECSEPFVRRGNSYAVKYDPRQNDMVSAVENQGNTDTCWAFATIAAIESNLIKNGYEKSDINLSEKHLAYFFYNRTKDRLGYTKGDSNKIRSGSSWAQNGGTLISPAFQLATWSGVIKETVSEDNKKGEFIPGSALSASACYKCDYRVKNVYFFNYNVKEIKDAVTKYGAVATGIYMSDSFSYWNPGKNAYYYSGKTAGNHAVTIVGWDDNFSRFNFNKKPKKDGAWIVKNSWGTGIGDGGYMYVSYEDTGLTQLVSYDMEKPSESYDNNYQYDGTGNYAVPFALANNISVANVFQAKGAGGNNETLKAVSIAAMQYGIKYSLQVYTGVTSNTNPTKGTKMLAEEQTGTLMYPGYQQIILQQPVTLQAGEKYSVVLKLSTGKDKEIVIDYDYSYNAGWINFVSKADTGQSFIGKNGKWQDLGKGVYVPELGKSVRMNLRIKAYTDSATEKTIYKLSEKSLNMSKGSSTTLKVSVSPAEIRRKVSWSSADKKVAVVSGKGKIKAKGYGTTVIKAKFVSGKTKKTLKCKVTVGPSQIKNFKTTGGEGYISVKWNKNTDATGYVIYYSREEKGNFSILTKITNRKTTQYIAKELVAGTYFIKMRPYIKKGNKILYGSDTVMKQAVVE